MAMTQHILLWMATLAAGLGFMGLFKPLDTWTNVLLTFTSAIAWALMGLSAWDVIVRDTTTASASEPVMPMVFLGLGMGFITALFGIQQLLSGMGSALRDEVDIG